MQILMSYMLEQTYSDKYAKSILLAWMFYAYKLVDSLRKIAVY